MAGPVDSEAEFDYVVVGSGAAGAIVAARLAEQSPHSICVLEAGGSDWHPYLRMPAGFIKVLFDPAYTWPLSSEPSAQTAGRRIPLPQGRVLGGSTSINGLIYNRGQAEDFDGWAAQGNPGWSWAEVLPYFQRTECWEGPPVQGAATELRGRAGRLRTTPIEAADPICDAFIAGAQELGMPLNPDYNGAQQAGVGYFQRSIAGGQRMSTARCFLHPAIRAAQGRLHVITQAQASRVLFEGTRAIGVEFQQGGAHGRQRRVLARREVIVCAGAVNTPKLLQLSGIGAAPRLQALGIPVLHHLPGVGEHLKDHFSVRLVAEVRDAITINEKARLPRLAGEVIQWLLGRPSILSLSPSMVHFFCNLQDPSSRPDIQGVFSPASYKQGYVGRLDRFPGMTCGVWQHRPRSSGWVRLQSPDPWQDPLIQPNYLEQEFDQQILLQGVRLARRLLQTQALAGYRGPETLPGPAAHSDAELLDYVRHYGVSSYHLNGSCRMGPSSDPEAVVNARLEVHGLQGLRIVDASVMPEIPSANTCAATMMVGERGADFVLADSAKDLR